jgi:mannitol/fructose-specific phosphotransferase system IIA component (Ntr-type)
MSLAEVSAYLKITEERLSDLAERGGIPASGGKSDWQFMRSVVDDWLIGYMKQLSKEELHRLIASDGSPVSLKSLVRPELVDTGIRAGSKESVLRQLAQILTHNSLLTDAEEAHLVGRLLDREEMVSTAIFTGVAIPHPRNPEEPPVKRPTVAVGICRQGTEFDSLDMESTYVFFLVCAGNELLHLKLIAELSLHLRRRDLVGRLISAPGPVEVVAELFG